MSGVPIPDQGSGAPAGASNAERLVRVLLKPFQRLENTFQGGVNSLLARSVDTSEGVLLTQIGNLVGQRRNGVSDDELYRRYVRARIATNKSRMVGDDILQIVELILGDDVTETAGIHAETIGEAFFRITIEGVVAEPVAQIIVTFLHLAAGAGIGFELVTYPAPDSDMFAFAGGTGKGWGDHLDPTTGGVLADGRNRT